MKITYIQHSGFAVELEDQVLIFDYYQGKLPDFDQRKTVYVFASHRHHDHFRQKIFQWEKQYPRIFYILSDDILADTAENRIFMGPDEEREVGGIRIKTLRSTDEGVAFFVCCPGSDAASGSRRIYHAGDLNWWHWEEEGQEYNREMEKNYKESLATLEDVHIDVAFVPVDPRLGDAYYWGLDWFMRHTDTELVYPMHLWRRYKVIDKLIKQPETADYRKKIVRLGKEDECR